MTLEQFLSVLARMPGEIERGEHAGLDHAGHIIEQAAKAKIGHEQSDWPDLAARTIADKERLGFGVPDPLLRTGELRDSITHTVHTHQSVEIGSNADTAEWQEEGTPTIPPRPFLSSAAVQNLEAAGHAIAEQVVRALEGKPPTSVGG